MEMLDNNHSTCPREDQILSYLYRELTPVETERFESHLAVCGSCVDELAAVSEPHLAVYEWRTNVFDSFPAPSIELPLVGEQRPHAEGLLGRLSVLLAGWPVGLRVGVGFAAVLVVGLSVLLITRPFSGTEVARKIEVPQVTHRDTAARNTSSSSVVSTVVATPSELDSAAGRSPEPVRAATRGKHETATSRKTVTVPIRRTELASTSKPKNRTQRSLRLNNFEEDEDKTLRLADLLEEVGSL